MNNHLVCNIHYYSSLFSINKDTRPCIFETEKSNDN